MSSERDTCLRKADEAKQRAAQNRPSRAHMKKWRTIGCYSPDWSLSLPPKRIAKTPSKKLTALPPGDVAADAQMAKGSPGRAGASKELTYLGIKVP